jgi:tetratricopeptide (TPR) repeat protein
MRHKSKLLKLNADVGFLGWFYEKGRTPVSVVGLFRTRFTGVIRVGDSGSCIVLKGRKSSSGGGENDRAVKLLTEAIRINPRNPKYYNNRGVAYKRLGLPAPALEDYTEALRLNPDSADAYNNRGVVYLAMGKPKKAVTDFNKALKIGGHKGRLYTNRGLAYLRAGDTDRAIEDLRRAIETGKGGSRPYYYLAQALEARGDKGTALRMYKVALKAFKGTAFTNTVKKGSASIEAKR